MFHSNHEMPGTWAALWIYAYAEVVPYMRNEVHSDLSTVNVAVMVNARPEYLTRIVTQSWRLAKAPAAYVNRSRDGRPRRRRDIPSSSAVKRTRELFPRVGNVPLDECVLAAGTKGEKYRSVSCCPTLETCMKNSLTFLVYAAQKRVFIIFALCAHKLISLFFFFSFAPL